MYVSQLAQCHVSLSSFVGTVVRVSAHDEVLPNKLVTGINRLFLDFDTLELSSYKKVREQCKKFNLTALLPVLMVVYIGIFIELFPIFCQFNFGEIFSTYKFEKTTQVGKIAQPVVISDLRKINLKCLKTYQVFFS